MLNFNWFENLVPYFKFAQDNLNNKDIFFVGWIIRDILLNIKIDDFDDVDITLAGDPKKVYSKLNQNAWSIFKTDKFWTITIVKKNWDGFEDGIGMDNKEEKINNQSNHITTFEVTPFRTEWDYSDARHPDELNWSDSLLDDSIRRDFTLNCLYYSFKEKSEEVLKKSEEKMKFKDNQVFNLEKEEFKKEKFLKVLKKEGYVLILNKDIEPILIVQNHNLIENISKSKIDFDFDKIHIILDPQNWINDILNQKIRAVWNPNDRIKEDALRIIRAIRFVSVLNTYEHINLDFDPKTWLSLKKYYFLIRKVAKERIIQETKKVFKKWNAFGFIALMDELNILQYYFPALANCKNNNQPTRYHPFDTYSHTILCLYHLQQINSDYLVRFGMLYHDVGKPDQYYWASIKKDEASQAELYKLEINHPIIWAEIAENDFRKLWFSNKEIEKIVLYVKYHMFPWELLFMSENKRKNEIKKFISKYGLEVLLNLCDVTIWDRLGQYNPLQHSDIKWIVDLKKEINKIYEESWRITLKELEINGNDIIKIVWKAWPEVGKILNKLLELVLEWKIENKKEELIKKVENLKIIVN